MTTTASSKNTPKLSFEKATPQKQNEAIERLVLSRISLLMKQPFFGNMATRMELVCADEWCGTCATDGRKFYYNTHFVLMLQQKELDFVFGHEVLHACYDHVGRFQDRIPELANIAADYVVNADLVDQGVGQKPKTVPVLYEPKYCGWSFEQVYEDLFNNAEKIDMQQLMNMLLDDHLDGEGDDVDGDGKDGSGQGRPRLSAEEKQRLRDEIKEAMLNAAQSCGAGNCPAGVQRLLKDLTEPKMNWRELLQQQIESCVKSDFTWMKPSRRGWHCDAILPGMQNGQALDVAIAIDTSGSISSAMLKDFLSEVNGIMQQFEDYKIKIWCFDTAVHNPVEFSHDSGEDLLAYECKGGGGTSFKANWEFMKSEDYVPKKLVFFTDGDYYDLPDPADQDWCDTIFVIHNKYNKREMDFGMTVQYE